LKVDPVQIKLSRYRWWIILSVVAVIGLVVAGAVIGLVVAGAKITQDKMTASTLDNSISVGMTYQQVQGIMTKAGWGLVVDERGRNLRHGTVWQNPEGGHYSIEVYFVENRVKFHSILEDLRDKRRP
jgi:hypothetical protein